MNKEVISDKDKIFMMVLFLVGSTSIFAPGLEAKRDAWIAVGLGWVAAIPMILIYARIHYIFPSKDMFDIVELCFGKFIGKIITVVFVGYAIYWTADVLNNYGQFIEVVSFAETPKIMPIIVMAILCMWGIKGGIEILGRWSRFFFLFPLVILMMIIILSIDNMNIKNIEPILKEGYNPLIKGAFSVFSQPFVQMIAFTMIFSCFDKKNAPYKIYFIPFAIAGVYMTLLTLINILVLGSDRATSVYYPAYAMVSKIDIGHILQRVEAIISISFILGGFVKVSVLLLCVCKGISKVFNYEGYRFIIAPIGLIIINLSYFQYDSVMNYMEFNSDIWPYYFFPFQVILPIIIWIVGEIKKDAINTLKISKE